METYLWLHALLVGVGATIVMDLWAWIQKRVFGIPSLNYAFVARWVMLMPKGKWVHKPIMATASVKGEKPMGWILHYLIGVIFALVHVCVLGEWWLSEPSLAPALATGAITMVFPFFIIQPCLGFGVAASKTPTPWKARWLSLLAHSSYGIGLFVSALVLKLVV